MIQKIIMLAFQNYDFCKTFLQNSGSQDPFQVRLIIVTLNITFIIITCVSFTLMPSIVMLSVIVLNVVAPF
jgi:hypothetical protein